MDGDQSITANFIVAVTGYRLWLLSEFNASERADENASGPLVDFDGDGRVNFLEYVVGSSPKQVDTQPVFNYDVLEEAGKQYLLISYIHDKAANDIDAVAEYSSGLNNWLHNANTEVHSVSDKGNGTEEITIRMLIPVDDSEQQFLRIKFAQ